jgi:hypothetical protein
VRGAAPHLKAPAALARLTSPVRGFVSPGSTRGMHRGTAMPPVQRQVGGDAGEGEILKHQAPEKPRQQLDRQSRETEKRHEGYEAKRADRQ